MNKLGELLTKHRNIFLLGLLTTTLVIGGAANQSRLRSTSSTVDIPVMAVSTPELSPLERFCQQRDQEAQSDMDALEHLTAQPLLDKSTREAAAEQLQSIIDIRQAQSAIEGALSNSSLSPCVAVIAGNALTIITSKSTVTDKDTALIMTLAAAHAGIQPENVRIITAE